VSDKNSIFIKTYGCQMNEYDSARLRDAMTEDGFEPASGPEEASLIVLNTCHIREKAAEKIYSELGRLRLVAEQRAERGEERPLIVVAGCVAQAEGEEMIRRAPLIDIVIGPQNYHRLPAHVKKARLEGGKIIDAEFPREIKFDHLPAPHPRRVSAFLTIQEGCDRFCSFCVVPYTRGAEYSRPMTEIIGEAIHLRDEGVREITLLGQNVNSWQGEDERGRAMGLAGLLAEMARIEGIERLRYTTSHPRDMSEELIAAHGEIEKLMPYLHLPIQSGSDRILKAMNRGHRAEDYLRLVEKIRTACPGIALSTDIIVGFPGESEEDFRATMELVREVKFAQAFSFAYSPRPGTPAARLDHQVERETAMERLHILQELLARQQAGFNRSLEGQAMPVLVEKPGREAGQVMGRSPYLQPVHMPGGQELIGQMVMAKILSSTKTSLAAMLA